MTLVALGMCCIWSSGCYSTASFSGDNADLIVFEGNNPRFAIVGAPFDVSRGTELEFSFSGAPGGSHWLVLMFDRDAEIVVADLAGISGRYSIRDAANVEVAAGDIAVLKSAVEYWESVPMMPPVALDDSFSGNVVYARDQLHHQRGPDAPPPDAQRQADPDRWFFYGPIGFFSHTTIGGADLVRGEEYTVTIQLDPSTVSAGSINCIPGLATGWSVWP